MSLLERIYHFHEALQNNRYPNATTIAEQFEVSLATARRDIAYLRDRLLAPIDFDQRANGFYYSETGFTLPFERSPKVLFFLGMLSKIADEAGLGSLPEVQSLEHKLSELVFPEYTKLVDAIHCEWVEIDPLQPSIFEEILEATVKNKILAISYRSAQAEDSTREVEPLRLINYQGRWYMLGHCTLREDIRLFHIARISKATITNKTFNPREHEDIEQYLNTAFGIFKGKLLYHASILFTSTAAELVRHQKWHHNQKVTETDSGVILELPVSDDREIMLKILQYGSMAQVLNPESLRSKVWQEAQAMVKLYS